MFIFLLLFLTGTSVVSANTIDFSKKGNINISLLDNDNKGISNAEITIYKIANAVLKNANLAYENIEQLNSCNIDLSKINENSITQELIDCVDKNANFKKTATTNDEGIVSFDDLDLAIYLVVQSKKVPGTSSIDPYMISIPQIEDNSWIYSINSIPKSDIYKIIDINVKKVWNNEGSKNPNSVTIELLNNGEVIDSVILNNENDWNYTWYDMRLNDKYSVREVNVADGYVDTYRQEGFNFIVTNTKKLPQTGLQLWLVETLSIFGIVLLIVGVTLNKKYENNK